MEVSGADVTGDVSTTRDAPEVDRTEGSDVLDVLDVIDGADATDAPRVDVADAADAPRLDATDGAADADVPGPDAVVADSGPRLDADVPDARDAADAAPLDAPDVRDAPDSGDAPAPDAPAPDVVRGPLDPPRAIWPQTSFRVTTRRPQMTWALSPGADGARVEICADRGCTRIVAAFDATGTGAQPPTSLPRGTFWWRLYSRVGATRGSVPSPARPFTTWSRDVAVDSGWAVGADFNGDGYADHLFVRPGADMAADIVAVYGGPASAFRAERVLTFGPSPYPDQRRARPVGDVNGDGFDDALLDNADGLFALHLGGPAGLQTSPGYPPTRRTRISRFDDDNGDGYGDGIYYYSDNLDIDELRIDFGGPGGVDATPGRVERIPSPGFSRTHRSVPNFVSLGDIHGDRRTDQVLLLGGYLFAVYLVRGGGGVTRLYLSPGDPAGSAPAYDVNGDGYADLFLCIAPSAEVRGYVRLSSGSAAGLVDTPGGVWTIDTYVCPTAFGDVNGDGRDDYANGRTLVYGARPDLASYTIPAMGYLALVGDMNGDGYDDIMDLSYTNTSARVFPGGAAGPGAPVPITLP